MAKQLYFRHIDSDYRHYFKPEEQHNAVTLGSKVYGPFDTTEELDAEATKLWPNRPSKNDGSSNLAKPVKHQILVFEAEMRDVRPSSKEKPDSEKRAPGNEANWRKELHDGMERWFCKECGAMILAARVAHPIHEANGAGFGECNYEDVGYCPNCELEPNFHGVPVTR